MKRIIRVSVAAVAYTVATAMVALAQEGGSSLEHPQGPAVAGTSGTNLGGTTQGIAFTGAEIVGLVLVGLLLVVAGIAAVLVVRRRSASVRVEA